MEIIIVAVVIAVILYFAFFRKKAEVVVEEVAYKIETPSFPVAEEVKSTVKKATTRKPKAEGEKTPAGKAKTARKPKAK